MLSADKDLIIERTDDGSTTLYIPTLDEHYHSTKGALAESRHVYIDMCWRRAEVESTEAVKVFEVGFGTGLNAALTAEAALAECRPTIYFSVELNPLDIATTSQLGYENMTPFFSAVNVYFDAFAPDKQPEMWDEQIIGKIYASMAPGGVLSTYCAKGMIRRRLQSIGFNVERLPGPVNGKREILRAVK